MDGRTIAALVIGLVTGYILTRAMRPPVVVVSEPSEPSAPTNAPTPPPAPRVVAAAGAGPVAFNALNAYNARAMDPRFTSMRTLNIGDTSIDSLAS